MILDYEQELSAAGGQLFNAADGNAEYGSKSYDMMAAGIDPSAGEPIIAVFKVHDANSDVGTSLDLEITADDDEAATNEVSLAKETILVASLTAETIHYVGPLALSKIASTNRYIRAKVTTHGSAATAGKLKVWLQKGRDAVPLNVAQPD